MNSDGDVYKTESFKELIEALKERQDFNTHNIEGGRMSQDKQILSLMYRVKVQKECYI